MENNSIKILVIDDFQDNLITLNALIKDAFPEAITLNAQNGKIGLEMAAQEDPDVILLDIIMPGMDGYEVCQKLKDDNILCDIPVVFVTAIKETKEALVKALECGGDAFLTKPIDEIELTAQIRVMLKIKEANNAKKDEKVRLEKLVEERNKKLVQELDAHKKTLEELRIKEAEKNVILQTTLNGFWIVDNQGKFIEANDAACKMIGYSKEEILKMSIQDIEAKETAIETANHIESAKKEGSSRFETKHRTKNGNIIDVEVSTTWMDSQNIFFAFLNDITERKQSEEALRESEELFKIAMNASNDGLFDWNFLTNEIYYSPGWKKIIGYEDHELPNDFSLWETTTEPEDVKKSWELQQKLISKQIDRFVLEFKMKHKDGHWVDILSRAKAIFDDEGKAIRIIGTHTDITERKQIEEVLKNNEALLNETSKTAKVGGWEINLLEDTLSWTNETFRIHELDRTEQPNIEEAINYYHPDDRSKVNEAVQKTVETGEPFYFEARLLTALGNQKWVLAKGNSVLENGKAKTIHGIIQDITDRKQAEEKLRQSEVFLKSSLESSKDIIMLSIDKDYKYLYFNQVHIEAMSYLYNTVPKLGESMLEIVTNEEDIIYVRKNFEKAFAGESHKTIQEFGEGSSRSYFETKYNPIYVDDEIMGASLFSSNITERVQAEEALKQSEYFFKETQRAALIGSYQSEFYPNDIWKTSEVCDEIFGIDDSYDKTVQGWTNLLHPNFAETIVRYVTEDVIGAGVPFNKEYQIIRHNDGETRWVHGLGEIIKDKNGRTTGLIGTIQDITERKQAEERLIKSEKLYRELVESMIDGVYKSTPEGRFLDVNLAMVKILGYNSKEELMAIDIKTELYFNETDRENKTAIGMQKGTDTYLLRKKDGSAVWVEDHGRYVLSGEGNILYHEGVIRDVTERKQAEEALLESESKIHSLIDSIDGIVWEADAKSVMFTYVSNKAKRLLGYEIDEWYQENFWTSHIYEEDKKNTLQYCISCTNNMQDHDFEYRFVAKSGEIVWLRDIVKVVVENGEPRWLRGIMIDITKSKLAEIQLRRLSQVVEQSPATTTITNPKGNIEYVNSKFTKLTGYTLEEVIGQTSNIMKSDKQSKEFYKGLWETISSGKVWKGEFCNKKKNGDLFWEIASVSPIFDEKGKIVNYIKVAEDITERKQAEENFRYSIDNSPLGIRIVNQAGKTIYVNRALLDIYEYSALDEFINTKSIERYTEKSYQEHLERKIIRQEGEGKSEYEISIRRKDGEIRHIKVWRKEVIWNMEKHFQVINQDITELKRLNIDLILAKEKAEESELNLIQINERFKRSNQLLDESQKIAKLGGWEFDLLANKLFWTAETYHIHDTSPEEFNPTVDAGVSYFLPESKKTIIEALDRAITLGEGYDLQLETYTTKGRKITVRTTCEVTMLNGKPTKLSGIFQDITEQKLTESELIEAKEKAEESNRLKTAFLNNMSHEIRTPLNGITGFIELLKDPEIDNEDKQEYFDIINKSSDRLITTVTDIIDISRIEAGEVKVSKTEVSVNDILEDQYNFFYHQAKSKGLELIYKPSLSDNEARFITDKNKLEGILTNLIKNAIKFTDQGKITFACSLKKEQDIDVLEFYIKDTGIGIPADRIEAVFNRFEQADIADIRAFQGSGLGLAIAKSYVEMLGGHISATSEVDSGSIFTFRIPYTKQFIEENETNENTNKEMQTTLSNLSVIIAEDDEVSTMLFDAIFKNEFNKITYTKSGKETIDLCREKSETDLILMDIKMPGMNGYDATREIRKFNSDVIIIAQTAFGLMGDREKALNAGCNDYIAKPINKNKLLEMTKKYFDK